MAEKWRMLHKMPNIFYFYYLIFFSESQFKAVCLTEDNHETR